MAAKEMYDYLSVKAPDNDVTLTIVPQDVLVEDCFRNQVVHPGDDGSEEVITLDSDVICYVTAVFTTLSEEDGGTIFDFWMDASKGNCIAESFKWDFPDNHTYVVKFRDRVARRIRPPRLMGFKSVRLKVLGKIAD